MHKEATRVGVRALRANLSGLLRKVRSGATIIVMSRNEVVAEIRPPPTSDENARRRPGTLKGRIKIAPDFDVLPDELLEAFEGE